MHPYQGVIVQFVNKDWELKSIVLDLTILRGPHTGKNMASALLKVLMDFNILHKLIAITTDNASNNKTMIEEISTKMKEQVRKRFSICIKINIFRCVKLFYF